mmetsp:Transcript_9502/g.22396  ORF Transcript_9502/g.22396 Transcript_9502/m.22396 type:complete len:351 (+) Transcript_9502:81-1133(+)|eukprot:CAMPEP_0185811168 /NCGR_PEP_ID=MMETSP1322-20130828/7644_1 /TAXON_ID=265543 /ORGANISM="Minutocellus polymorphus, Strain RCC2270" /LENGTH=350 /DNA_ID=CAMNT_0028507555 /DNA_START=50 /DNA_END=1102 /DNA_ORIENTATION=+
MKLYAATTALILALSAAPRASADNHTPGLRQLQTANTWYEIIDTEGSWQFVDEDIGVILELDAAGTLIQSAPGGVGINTAIPTATLDVAGTANVSGDSTLGGNAAVGGTLDVTGATTGSTATYSSDVSVGGTLGVTGTTTLATGVVLSEDAHTITHSGATSLAITSTTGYVSVEDVEINASSIGVSTKQDLVGLAADGVTIDGTLTTTGDISVAAITASAAVTAASTLDVASDTTVGGTFAATGVATLGAGLAVAGPATVGGTLTVTQTLTAIADAAIAGAATVGGTFDATGAATFGGDVTITGDVTIVDGMLKRVSSGGTRRLKSFEEQDAEIDQLRKELDAIKKHLNL